MATPFECPACRRKVQVPEHLYGCEVMCPGCFTMFTAIATIQDAGPSTRPPEERGRRPDDRDQRWE